MPQNWIDQPSTIRKGEELDILQLQSYLLENLPDSEGELAVEQFPGGASNLTYLIRLGKQQLVLRRPPFGTNVKSAHDMGREYKVLSALSQHYPKAPKPFLYTEDESIIGAPFYIMERVNGVVLRSAFGKAKELSKETMGGIASSLIDTLVELHALDYEKTGLGQLGKPQGYVTRQIVGWSKRYYKSQTDDIPEADRVINWLNENILPESGASIIHNDFKYDNVILDAGDLTKVKAILDWEMCTVGDPLMDLGTTLGYWPNPNDPAFMRTRPSALPGNPTRDEFIQMYSQKSGRDVSNVVFYFAYGLFKLAVILQQIYYRYHKGYTKDSRFAEMNQTVAALIRAADRAIEKNRINDLY